MRDNFNSDFEASSMSSSQAASGKKVGWLRRVFRPRDILIRSQGRVTFINLSPRIQIAASLGVATTSLWLLGATASSFWQASVIQDRNAAIGEAKLSYEQMQADFQTYKKELERLTVLIQKHDDEGTVATASVDGLGLSEEMLAFRVLGEKVNDSLERAALDFNAQSVEGAQIIASRDNLKDQILELRAQLLAKEALQNELLAQAQGADARLKSAIAEYKSLEERQKTLGRQVKELTLALSEARDFGEEAEQDIQDYKVQLASLEGNNEELSKQKASLEEKLELSREEEEQLLNLKQQAEERIALLHGQFDELMTESGIRETRILGSVPEDLSNLPLSERLTVLEETSGQVMSHLVEFRDMSDTVERTLDGVVASLSRVTGYSRETDAQNKTNKPAQAVTLLGKLETIHQDQLSVVSALLDRTEKAIIHKQATLSGTGLDIEQALQLAGLHTGQGGPAEATDFTGGTSSELNTTVAALEQKVARLQALDKLISCVPLVTPVDYYHVTSKFGKRKDPFTKKLTMHKGVDLGGWAGTPVYATAAGTVVKAGHSSSYGKMVEVDHGCGITTIYGHLKKIEVKKGQEISHRDKIGKLGSTGRSTGPHVHYEIRVDGEPLDPLNFIEAGRYVYKG